MEKKLKELLEKYSSINSKIFTPTRLLILNLLKFHKDGLQFREFQESIHISDGNLYSNLELLKSLSLINSEKVDLDNKSIEIYTLSIEGLTELNKINKWLKDLQDFGDQNED